MSACLLIIDDGREDFLERCLESVGHALPVETMPLVLVRDNDHRLGFAGAIAEGWRRVLTTHARYVVHVESDFVFNEPVRLERIIGLLARHPRIAQVSLKRQPCNPVERAAGGIVEANPDLFVECREEDLTWTEHRVYWTTTPAVYAASWCERGWPQVPLSEGIWTHQLLADPDLRFAIWGGKFDAPRVEHIGLERAGIGY